MLSLWDVYFLMFSYFERLWAGEGQRRGEQKIWVGSMLTAVCQWTQCGVWTHEPWDHDVSRKSTDWATQAPVTVKSSKPYWVCLFKLVSVLVQAAITKLPKTGCINNRNLFLTFLGARMSKINVLDNLVAGQSLLAVSLHAWEKIIYLLLRALTLFMRAPSTWPI